MPTEKDIEPAAAPLNLVTKLAMIMGELGAIEKKGTNKAQNYKFVRESDLVAAVVPLLAKHHIILHTTITSHDRSPLYQTSSGMTMWITTVTVDGTWLDGDTGEESKVGTFIGTGADTGDKGVYKAMTGAEKYFLMKGFLVSTGDDPEADEKVDKTTAAAGAASGTRVARGSQPGVQRGGRSSVATTAQVSEIARLAKDLGLDADGVVPVIKKVIGTEPDEGQTIRQWLGSMTNVQASEIIAALSTPNGGNAVDNSTAAAETVEETTEEEAPAALTVV